MRAHTVRTGTCRTLQLAAIALACMLTAAHAEWNAGTFTDGATYTATANWVGGVIDDVISPSTTVRAGSPNDDVRFQWTFAANRATGAGGIKFDYTIGANSPNLILRGNATTARTLTLNGDFYWDQNGSDESGIIGAWTASDRLNLDLGGGDRAFVMVGQSGSGHGLRIWNNISNGGAIFDLNSPINQGDTGGASNAGGIIYDTTAYAGTTTVRSGLLRVRNTPSWAPVQTSGAIANSQRIAVGNNTRKLRFQGYDSYGSPNQLEIGDNASGNLNRVGDSATVALDSGWVRFRHGNAAAAGGTENIGNLELTGFSVLEAWNHNATQSYTVQADAFTRPDRGTARVGLSSAGGAVALNLDTAPPTIGGGGAAGTTKVSIVPFLTGSSTLVTCDGTTGLRALNTSTEFVNGTVAANFMAAADDDNVRTAAPGGSHATITLTGNKTINSLVILNQGGGFTTTLNGTVTLTVTSGAVLFDGPAGAAYSDFLNVQTLAFGSAEGVISVQNLRGDQRKEVNAIITGSGGVTFSSDKVDSNNSGNNGRLVIAGANSYTGPTTFTKGLFQLSGANRIPDASAVHVGSAASVRFSGSDTIAGLTGRGHLNNNAATVLTISNAGTNDFSGEIAGTIALAKSGDGTQILSGTNTYTGSTTIHAGTLRIGGSGVLGSGSYAGAITNNGTLAYASSATQTVSGVIFGTGALHKEGGGTLTLSGANTCTGATVVQAGVLELTLTNALASAAALDIRSGGEVRLSFTGTSVIRSITVNGVTKPRGIYAAGSLPGLTGMAGAFVETLEPPPTGTLIAIR